MSKKTKKTPKRSADLSKDQLSKIVQRLESGQSTLFEESTKAGLTPNTPLRNALRAHLGGKASYSKMIERSKAARSKATVKPGAKKRSAKKAHKPEPAPEADTNAA